MARATGRVVACGASEARTRLRQAQAFIAVADLVVDDGDNPDLALDGVVAALAVLAGIAAADAVCCTRLGKHFRGQDHAQAVDLVRTVQPHGDRLARDLGRLLAIKDNVHYQALAVSGPQAGSAVTQAKRMVTMATEIVT